MTTMRMIGKNFVVGVLLVLLLGGAFAGCASVRFCSAQSLHGENWTVYQHMFGPDTITYCLSIDGSACLEAAILDGPPPGAAPTTPQPPSPAP